MESGTPPEQESTNAEAVKASSGDLNGNEESKADSTTEQDKPDTSKPVSDKKVEEPAPEGEKKIDTQDTEKSPTVSVETSKEGGSFEASKQLSKPRAEDEKPGAAEGEQPKTSPEAAAGKESESSSGLNPAETASNSNNPAGVPEKGVEKTAEEGEQKMPRRFRSAFILFSSERHRQIRNELGQQGKLERVSKRLSTGLFRGPHGKPPFFSFSQPHFILHTNI